jgi:hypothetical protein
MAIPASTLVSVTPSVLNPGGTGLNLAALILTQNALAPYGPPLSFANLTAVGNYFGTGSTEYAMAQVYFNGYDASSIKPGLLWFGFYPTASVAAWMRGAALPLWSTAVQATVQAYIPAVTAATTTIAGTTMTVATVSSGVIAPGQVITGGTVTTGTRVVSQLSGTAGGAGTYTVSLAQTQTSFAATCAYDLTVTIDGVVKTGANINLSTATSWSAVAALLITALSLSAGQVAYNSLYSALVVTSATTGASSTITFGSGALANVPLGLCQTSGALLSQGAVAVANYTAFMLNITTYTTNWATFTTTWEPTLAVKQGLATWTAAQNTRYMYVPYDSDATVIGSPSAFSGFGYWLRANSISGVMPIYNDLYTASMVCGMVASIDFAQLNGRVNFMFKTSSQVPNPIVLDATSYANMLANGYSAYCQFGVQSSPNMLANGQVSGQFLWADSYIGALYLAVSLQQAMVTLLQQQKSLPYNAQGYGLITAAALDPINAALNFGTIRANVAPSSSQIAQMNAAAGQPIDGIVGTRGWYLMVSPASAATRTARQSPPIALFYMDGQSVQQINIASVDVL